MAEGWFATDDEDEVDEAQRAVLEVLRARASSGHWPMIDPADTNVALPGHVSYGYLPQPGERSFGKLLAWLDVPDPGEGFCAADRGGLLHRHGHAWRLPS